jgi:hypothetical protein
MSNVVKFLPNVDMMRTVETKRSVLNQSVPLDAGHTQTAPTIRPVLMDSVSLPVTSEECVE